MNIKTTGHNFKANSQTTIGTKLPKYSLLLFYEFDQN